MQDPNTINVKPLSHSSTSSSMRKNNLNVNVSGLQRKIIQKHGFSSSIQLGQEKGQTGESIVDQALMHDKAQFDPLKMSFGGQPGNMMEDQSVGGHCNEDESQYQSPGVGRVQLANQNQTPIQVIARVRPQIKSEMQHPISLEVVKDSWLNGYLSQVMVKHGLEQDAPVKNYTFEKVLDTHTSQSEAFEACNGLQLCHAFLNGQNCTIFVYGPTSTGKTFTMQGNAEEIIQRNHSEESINISDMSDDDDGLQTPGKNKLSAFAMRESTTTKRKKERGFKHTAHDNLIKSARVQREASRSERNMSFDNGLGLRTQLKQCKQAMQSSNDKGVIQRVIDAVYKNFYERESLFENCEIKISFLEVYNDSINDLLDKQSESPQFNFKGRKRNSRRGSATSLDLHSDEKKDEDLKSKEEPLKKSRTKAKTMYGIGDLQDLKNKNQSKLVQDKRQSQAEDQRSNYRFQQPRDSLKNSIQHFTAERASEAGLKEEQKKYQVKENAIKGVYVKNSVELDCPTQDSAYQCLLNGLMRKKVSQTVRNTASSRSHTIFQIKMYYKKQDNNSHLLPQYQDKHTQDQDQKLVSKFSLIDLAGSERIAETEKNVERLQEAKFINKSLSALGNVVAALRTQATKESKQQQQNSANNTPMRKSMRTDRMNALNGMSSPQVRRQSMFSDKPPDKVTTHIPYRDSKLTHILKDSLGSNTFTHLIITLSPSYLCLGETISTLQFTKNAKAVRQNIVENTAFKNEIQQRVNLKAAMENKNRGQRSLSMGAGGQNSLLNQMAGSAVNNDEDEQMLQDIIGELGGIGLEGGQKLNIATLFKMTLLQLKKFKQDHQDMTKQIEDMKKAMDKDLSNQEVQQMIKVFQSRERSGHERLKSLESDAKERSNLSPSQFMRPARSAQEKNSYKGQDRFTTIFRGQRLPSGFVQAQNSLKSISEENMDLSSPYGAKSSQEQLARVSQLSQQTRFQVKNLAGSHVSVNSKQEQPPLVSSNSHPAVFSRYDSSPKHQESQAPQKQSWFNQMFKGFFSNDTEIPAEQLNTTHLDTEPGEMNETIGRSIPMSNVTKLRRNLEYKTLRQVMARYIRTYLIQKQIFTPKQKSNKRIRQKSFDFLSMGSPSGDRLIEKLDGNFNKNVQVNITNVDKTLFQTNQTELVNTNNYHTQNQGQSNFGYEIENIPDQAQENITKAQKQLKMRRLHQDAYQQHGIRIGELSHGQELREIPSRAQAEDSEFYATESSVDEHMKMFENSEENPANLSKFKEKTEDVSVSLRDMKKLARGLEPNQPNSGNIFDKSQNKSFSSSQKNNSNQEIIISSRGSKPNIKVHQLRMPLANDIVDQQKERLKSRSPGRSPGRSPQKPEAVLFNNSNELDASFPFKRGSAHSQSMIEQRAGDFAEPSISTIQRIDQSTSTITKNDEMSFTSQNSSHLQHRKISGHEKVPNAMRKAISSDQPSQETPHKANFIQQNQDTNTSANQAQKRGNRKIAGYFSQANGSQSAQKQQSIQIEDQQLGMLSSPPSMHKKRSLEPASERKIHPKQLDTQHHGKQTPSLVQGTFSPQMPHTGRAFGPGAGLMNRGKAPSTQVSKPLAGRPETPQEQVQVIAQQRQSLGMRFTSPLSFSNSKSTGGTRS